LVEPNNFSKQIAVRDKIPEDILHFAEKLWLQPETIQSEH
jgi:hypothetical protein